MFVEFWLFIFYHCELTEGNSGCLREEGRKQQTYLRVQWFDSEGLGQVVVHDP